LAEEISSRQRKVVDQRAKTFYSEAQNFGFLAQCSSTVTYETFNCHG